MFSALKINTQSLSTLELDLGSITSALDDKLIIMLPTAVLNIAIDSFRVMVLYLI